MYLNKSTPDPQEGYSNGQQIKPNYVELVRFLVQPFLDSPESVKVDCELSNHNSRVWIRLAFEADDKGRVFGRGGRNIQAIRAVLEAAASAAGQSVHLDIYGSHAGSAEGETVSERKPPPKKDGPRRAPRPSSLSRNRDE